MSVKLNRNNTNFPLELIELYRKIGEGPPEYQFLKYYQRLVRHYVTSVDVATNGLLISLQMGMGKSITAIAIAIDMLQVRPVIMVLAKSLEENMRQSVHKYVSLREKFDPDFYLVGKSPAELDEWIDHHFSFVSMNASNMMDQVHRAIRGRAVIDIDKVMDRKLGQVTQTGSLNGKLVIVDEAHNMFRAIMNGSKNGIKFYDLVMRSENLKIVFLTGTPISNDPFEMSICFNMLAGRALLPESYKEFYNLYVTMKNTGDTPTPANTATPRGLKNREKFQNRIMGLASFVNLQSTPGAGIGITDSANKAEFPEQLPTRVIEVNMDSDQYVQYNLARELEQNEGKFSASGKGPIPEFKFIDASKLVKPKGGASSTYRVKSRQLGNYCAPGEYRAMKDPLEIPAEMIDSPKYRAVYAATTTTHKDQCGLVYSQFIGVGGLGTFARFLEKNGWHRHNLSADTSRGEPVEADSDDIAAVDATEAIADETPEDLQREQPIVGSLEATSDIIHGANLPSVDDILRLYGGGECGAESDRGSPDIFDFSFAREEDLAEINSKYGSDFTTRSISAPNFVVSVRMGAPEPRKSTSSRGYVAAVDGVVTSNIPGAGLIEEEKIISDALEFVDRIEPIGDSDDTSIYIHTSTGGADAGPVFAIISGAVSPADRARIMDEYNNPDNAHGKRIRLLLVSSTGAEGLDLKRVRHIHIMEPYWTMGRIHQITYRGVRNDSHIDLPAEEKNVATYVYIAVPPISERRSDGSYPMTTDRELYTDAEGEMQLITSFIAAIEEVSIEAGVNAHPHARICSPTNQKLFIEDPVRDLLLPDPCHPIREERIAAVEIVVDGAKFYYKADPASAYGYKIFAVDEKIQGIRELKDSDPRFDKVLDAIIDEKPATTVLKPTEKPKK